MSSESKNNDQANDDQSRADELRYEQLLAEAAKVKGTSLWQDAKKRLRRDRGATVSMYFLIAICLSAVFAPLLPLQSPVVQNLNNRQFLPPTTSNAIYKVEVESDAEVESVQPQVKVGHVSLNLVEKLKQFNDEVVAIREQLKPAKGKQRSELQIELENKYAVDHPYFKVWNQPDWLTRQMIHIRVMIFGDYCVPSLFGTDKLGRDVLSRVFWGSRVSLMAGVIATLVSLFIGVSYGAISGYYGGTIDAVMMRIVDILYSIPFIFIVIFVMTLISQENIKLLIESLGLNQLLVFYIIIGLIYWLTMARVVRGQILSLKNEQFVDAARVVGANNFRIIFCHLVPNTMGIVIVYLTLTIPAVMRFEAFLSFLGVGVSPPDVSWGLLVNEGIQVITPVRIYWWLVLFPGLTLTLTLLALNFLGDGLRDALDPRMKNK
ncbi:MAG: oligopeptide transport system permease protein [Pirellulaceae bacterium]|jgi:oligopeptide transport system permease protein